MSVSVARPERDVVALVGPDARSFLQSLVSQDLDPLGDGDGAHSLLLTPQGKLDVEFVVLLIGPEELWLVCEGGYGEQLAASLQRFKVRVKAEIQVRPDLELLAVRGTRDVTVGSDAYAIPARWPDDAIDVVGAHDAVLAVEDALAATGAETLTAEDYETLRISAGVPRQGVDVDERTIPQEAFLERDAVSFTKGCFLGQELVCRIDTRGHVNRYLRRLRLPADAVVPRGAEVVAGDKVVGDVTSVGTGGVALATVRREIDPPASVTIRWDAGEVPGDLLN